MEVKENKKTRRRFSVDIEDEFLRYDDMHDSDSRILEKLQKEFPDDSPTTIKSIKAMRERLQPLRDQRDVWSVYDASATDALLVLPVLAEMVVYSEGTLQYFSKAQATWIGRIRAIAPDLPADRVFRLVNNLIRGESIDGHRHGEGKSADEYRKALNFYLALAPWRSEQAYINYKRCLDHSNTEDLLLEEHFLKRLSESESL